LELVPVKRVEQFVKLQQMPVSTSIFFIWFIILVLEFIPCGSNPSGIAPFDHKGWDICRGTQKIIGCPWNSVVFISSDGGGEFAKEEQNPGAKGSKRSQPSRICDDPGNP
jgi:hypothetical protein